MKRNVWMVAVLAALSSGVQPLAAQAPVPASPATPDSAAPQSPALWQRARDRFTGDVVVTSESYAQQGGENRQPGETWAFTFDPRFSLVGGMAVGFDVLLSSDGNQLRQNINQFGLNPHWSWGTAHVGDFSDGMSQYTTQGLRVRGLGVDLNPGLLRFSLQGGQTQRAVVGGLAAGPVYARRMLAGRIGVGHEGGTFLDLEVVKVKDDPNSVSQALVVADTVALDSLVNDTIPAAFRTRPQSQTRPEENLVTALTGQMAMFDHALRVRGEVAGSVLSGDVTSPLANTSAIAGARLLNGIMPIRLSTSGDLAYNVESELTLSHGGLRGSYAYLGPGYTSLGLGYVMNDQRQYSLGGDLAIGDGLVALQGQYDHQNDNLLGQKLATTNRDVVSGTVALHPMSALTTSLTGMVNLVGNHAPVDTFVVSNRALSLTSSTALMHQLFGTNAVSMLTYGFQKVDDASGLIPAPRVVVQDLSASEQLNFGRGMSLAPTLSGVVTQTGNAPDQHNMFVGFRGVGRFLNGKLRPMGSISQSFTNGRRILAVRTETNYTLPDDVRLQFSTRYTAYGAYGPRAAFQESFVTTSLARTF